MTGWTGVQPGMKYEYFAPVGTGIVAEWENQGWDKDDAIAYLKAYYANWSYQRSKSICGFPEQQTIGTNSTCTFLRSSQAKPSQRRPSMIFIRLGNRLPIDAAEKVRKNSMRNPMPSSHPHVRIGQGRSERTRSTAPFPRLTFHIFCLTSVLSPK